MNDEVSTEYRLTEVPEGSAPAGTLTFALPLLELPETVVVEEDDAVPLDTTEVSDELVPDGGGAGEDVGGGGEDGGGVLPPPPPPPGLTAVTVRVAAPVVTLPAELVKTASYRYPFSETVVFEIV